MDVSLFTQSKTCSLVMRELKLFRGGSDGGCCFIEVVSAPFSASADFFFDSSLVSFVKKLEEIDKEFVGEAKLELDWEEPYIAFRGDGLGHVEVSGLLVDTRGGNVQKLEFSFGTDQTALGPFIENLRDVCNSNT